MQHIQGENRNQMFMFSLESSIPTNSFVRVLDAFVGAIDLKSFGFAHAECTKGGKPVCHSSVLKILNGTLKQHRDFSFTNVRAKKK